MKSNEGEIHLPETQPKIIGLTGGIGSGKTTVAKLIEEMGYLVYNSDFWAKELVNLDEDLKIQIIDLLGTLAYDELGHYNRKWVSEKVFENDDLLKKLNAIIHPAVRKHFENWVKQQNPTFVFKETALLFELKLNESCYKSILVTADDHLRMKRVMDRDEKTYREVETIIEKQMPEKDKIKLADYVIYNNTSFTALQESTKEVMFLLLENGVEKNDEML